MIPGTHNESVLFAEDFEWIARARAAGVIMAAVPEIVFHKRVHQTNTTHQLKQAQGTVTQTLMQIVRARRSAGSAP